MKTLVTAEQTLAAARAAGLSAEQLRLADMAVLTFSGAVLERLGELCGLRDAAWLGAAHHPYAVPEVVRRGTYGGMAVAALVPPMGASPLACIIEDLAACGVRAVFLVCAAWSLGPPVRVGDLVVPAYSLGPDGTSQHYGNTAGRVRADARVVEALAGACRELRATVHVGGNGTCEALYRITPEMAAAFREEGCLCMENGEASTLFAATVALDILGGALFQPYIELDQGWNPALLRDERYRSACRVQAEASLRAAARLKGQGVLR